MASSSELYSVEIYEQPQDKSRFRYNSCGGKHGSLFGKTDKGEGTAKKSREYPKLKIHNYEGKVKITISLVTCEQGEPGEPHVHSIKADKRDKLYEKKGDDGTCELRADVTQRNGGIIPIPGLYICTAGKKNVEKYLEKQYLTKAQNEKTNLAASVREFIATVPAGLTKTEKDDCKKRAMTNAPVFSQNHMNIVILRFDVETIGQFPVKCEPAFSVAVKNEKEKLKICRVSKPSCSAEGGCEIMLFCTKVTKDMQVRFREFDSDGKETWCESVAIPEKNIHRQFGVYFNCPKYKDQSIKDVVKVKMDLYRPSDDWESDTKDFLYYPVDVDEHEIKRKRQRTDTYEQPTTFCDATNPSLRSSTVASLTPQFSPQTTAGVGASYSSQPEQTSSAMDYEQPDVQGSDSQETLEFLDSHDAEPNSEQFESELENIDYPGYGSLQNTGGPQNLESSFLSSAQQSTEPFLPFQPTTNTNESIDIPKLIEVYLATDGGSRKPKRIYTSTSSRNSFWYYPTVLYDGIATILWGISHRVIVAFGYTSLWFRQRYCVLSSYVKRIQKWNAPKAFLRSTPQEAILSAVASNDLRQVTELLAKEGEKFSRVLDGSGNTLLHLAARFGKDEMISLVIHHFYNEVSGENPEKIRYVNRENYNGYTALHLAVKAKSYPCVEILCSHKADVDQPELSSGKTSLHLAVEQGDKQILRFLIKAGANSNIRCMEGKTPFYMAEALYEKEIVEFLLSSGADPSTMSYRDEEDDDDDGDGADYDDERSGNEQYSSCQSQFEKWLESTDEDVQSQSEKLNVLSTSEVVIKENNLNTSDKTIGIVLPDSSSDKTSDFADLKVLLADLNPEAQVHVELENGVLESEEEEEEEEDPGPSVAEILDEEAKLELSRIFDPPGKRDWHQLSKKLCFERMNYNIQNTESPTLSLLAYVQSMDEFCAALEDLNCVEACRVIERFRNERNHD